MIVFPIYLFLIKRLTLMAASTLLFIEPVLALIIDAVWERQIRLSPHTYLGAAITLLGVAVNLRSSPLLSTSSR